MATDKTAAKRARAHIRYELADGTRVPGVTTVLNVLNKPALVNWANKLGLDGIEVNKYVDVLATIGTVAHAMILAHHKGEQFPGDEYDPEIVDKAENCLISFFEWEKKHDVEVVLAEASLVSEQHRYGGTMDLYCRLDGVLSLIDYKTGKGIFPEHMYQVAAYRNLLEEHGHKVEQVKILRVGRDENEGFDEKSLADTSREWAIFSHALKLYQLGVGKIAA